MADVTTGPIHLTLLMGPKIPVPVPAPVTDALLSAQVTVASGQRSGFQLAFDLSKSGLINTTLLPAGFFDPKIRVVLAVTVQGTVTVLMDGVIIRQEVGISNQPGQSTLTVTGEDLTVLMDLEEKAAVPFPAAGPAARVAAHHLPVRAVRDHPARHPRAGAPDPDAQPNASNYQTGTDLDVRHRAGQGQRLRLLPRPRTPARHEPRLLGAGSPARRPAARAQRQHGRATPTSTS